MGLPRCLVFSLLCLLALFARPSSAQADDLHQQELERQERDIQQLLQVHLAGLADQAKRLTEMVKPLESVAPPECVGLPLPTFVSSMTAQLETALRTTLSRHTELSKTYETRLDEYNSYSSTDSRRANMYYSLLLQRADLMRMTFRLGNLLAIHDSYEQARRAVPGVSIAACAARDNPRLRESAESLSNALQSLVGSYRATLVQVLR